MALSLTPYTVRCYSYNWFLMNSQNQTSIFTAHCAKFMIIFYLISNLLLLCNNFCFFGLLFFSYFFEYGDYKFSFLLPNFSVRCLSYFKITFQSRLNAEALLKCIPPERTYRDSISHEGHLKILLLRILFIAISHSKCALCRLGNSH